MAIRVVRLGTTRARGEGVRLGTVRRPPRGVAKDRFSADNWFDVWLPNLSPSAALLKAGLAADDDRAWRAFVKKYEAEMARPEQAHVIRALAALSHHTNFSVGCYCENESRCHRSALKQIFIAHGASLVD
jgi:uncharacterized protein YeaO (DUF488 family)